MPAKRSEKQATFQNLEVGTANGSDAKVADF